MRMGGKTTLMEWLMTLHAMTVAVTVTKMEMETNMEIKEKKEEDPLDAEARQYKALRTAKWGKAGVPEDAKAPV